MQAFTPRNLNNVFLEHEADTPASKGTHLALESSFCEQLIRDKVDTELVKKEALELHKQLDKSRKDYAKLLS